VNDGDGARMAPLLDILKVTHDLHELVRSGNEREIEEFAFERRCGGVRLEEVIARLLVELDPLLAY
jgi:hypothetical protein